MADQDNKSERSFHYVSGDDVTGKKQPTNYVETLVHVVKGYVGTGIFAMGAAFLNSGTLLGPLFLFSICSICIHCQHILVRANVKIAQKATEDVVPSYAETVRFTFEDSSSKIFQKCSKAAGVLTIVFLLIMKYGVNVVYLIFISTHIQEIADSYNLTFNYRVWLAIILFPMWLTTFLTSLKYLTPLSLIANILIWTGIGIILYYTSQNLGSLEDRNMMTHFKRWPKFLGISLFAFSGTSFVLNVRMEMKNPDQLLTCFGVLHVAMFIVLSLYILVGFMSYYKYGDCIKGSVFLNLPAQHIPTLIAQVGTTIAIVFSYTFYMYIPFEICYPMFHTRFGPFKHPYLMRILYKSFWVLVTYTLANIDDRLDSVIGLVGGFAGAVITMVLPALIELAERHGNLRVWILLKDLLIIAFAFFGAAASTYLSFMEILRHLQATVFEEAADDNCTSSK